MRIKYKYTNYRRIITSLSALSLVAVMALLLNAPKAMAVLPADPGGSTTQPPGTCFVAGGATGPCGTVAPGVVDNQGNPLSATNCYDVAESSQGTNVTQVNCDGSALAGGPSGPTGGSSASWIVSSPASGASGSCLRISDDALGISTA